MTHPQLLAAGMTPAAIRWHLRAGRLHPKHRGVYALGHPAVGDLGRMQAAILACGDGALLSHRAAAGLGGFFPQPPNAPLEVLVPRGRCRARPGITIHRTRFLPDCDRSRIGSIPVTSVARTLRDLASVVRGHRYRRAFEDADRARLVDRDELREILTRSAGHRGVDQLRRLAGLYPAPPPRTRSRFEYRFFRHWEGTGLEPPEMNAKVAGFEVDCLWRRYRMVVELDSPAFHDIPDQAEFDRRKSVKLALAGLQVHRYSPNFFYEQTGAMVAEIAALLRLRAQQLGLSP